MLIHRTSQPRVTLLIPCYNASAFVSDAVASALAQTYGHVEVIVAPDDGNTYQELRHKFTSPQLRIIAPGPQARTGPGASRNRAIDASSGEFFAMLDADDIIPPTYLEDLMKVALVEGAAVANTRYTKWNPDELVRLPPVHRKTLTLSGLCQSLASIHPLIHRSFEVGYSTGFAQDVIHDGLILAKAKAIAIVGSTAYTLRLRRGSLCNAAGDADAAERAIQASYADRIDQILFRPSEISAQVLAEDKRDEFADLFRFRAFVSKRFSASGAACYNTWLAGKEAAFWDRFSQEKWGFSSNLEVLQA